MVAGEVARVSPRLHELGLSMWGGELYTLVTSPSVTGSPAVSFAVVPPSLVSVSLAGGPWVSAGKSGRDTVSGPRRFTGPAQ
jgi:hypothetical protein